MFISSTYESKCNVKKMIAESRHITPKALGSLMISFQRP